MQVQQESLQDEVIERLQRQVEKLTAENQLLHDQLARKDQFATMIAHELRSPLTPIINYAQMAARPNQRRETIERGTNIIISQAWRLARLANDLLDSQRLSTGQFTLRLAPCDAVTLVKETVEQLRPIAPYHHFEVDVPQAPIPGNWDYERLQQALGNLIDNAIKYSDDGTTISVRAWQHTGMACISVHNEGQSISPEEAEYLFLPYSRLPKSSARKGTGLGLYIAKCIIEEHGGQLYLASTTAENQGTTFIIELHR